MFLLRPLLLKQQLTVYNDGDIPIKICWNSPKQVADTASQQLVQQQGEEQQVAERTVPPTATPAARGPCGLLVTVSPAECIVGSRSFVSLDISCLGILASPCLVVKAYCQGAGLMLPLQVTFAAACSGASITYALFTEQQLKAAASLLQQKRLPQEGLKVSAQHQNAFSALLQKGTVEERQHEQDVCLPGQEASVSSRSRASSVASPRTEDENEMQQRPKGVAATLKAAGIGTWGVLKQQWNSAPHGSQGAPEVELPALTVGEENSFLYLLAINDSPIKTTIRLDALTSAHQQQQTHQQEPVMRQQRIRHPSYCEDGRPVGALMCPDCTSSSSKVYNEVGSSSSREILSSWLAQTDACFTSCTNSSNHSSSSSSATNHNNNSGTKGRNGGVLDSDYLSAEALLVQAASFAAPSEMQHSFLGSLHADRPSFKTAAGVRALQITAARRRRQQLLRATDEGLVIIPHPESSCVLQQQQAALLALEMLASLPANFDAALRLSLEPSLPSSQQLQQHQQVVQHQAVTLIPLKVPVRGPLLQIPSPQQCLRFRDCMPPLMTAQIALQQPSMVEKGQKQLQQKQHSNFTSYRTKTKLMLLKMPAKDPQVAEPAAAVADTQQKQQQQCQQGDKEQRITFRIENSSSKWLHVNWILFDIGLWEMQQKLERQLQQAATLREAAIEALRQRVVGTACEAAAAAEAAVGAAAAATSVAAPTAVAPSRKPQRSQPAKTPDLAVLAAEAAAAAAVAAEEASMRATEAAAAAAEFGILKTNVGWKALGEAATPANVSAAAADGDVIAKELLPNTTLELESSRRHPSLYASPDPLAQTDRQTVAGEAAAPAVVSKAAIIPQEGPGGILQGPSLEKGAGRDGPVDLVSTDALAPSSAVPGSAQETLPTSSEEKPTGDEAAAAAWADRYTELLPPHYCLVSDMMPLLPENRAVAAAVEVLRSQKTAALAAPQRDLQSTAEEQAGQVDEATILAYGDAEAKPTGLTAHAAGEGTIKAVTSTQGSATASMLHSCDYSWSARGTRCSTELPQPSFNADGMLRCPAMTSTKPTASGEAAAVAEVAEPAMGGVAFCHKGIAMPRMEPSEFVLAPYGTIEVSLCCGALQTSPGYHRLRAVGVAAPISMEAAQTGKIATTAAARDAYPVEGKATMACNSSGRKHPKMGKTQSKQSAAAPESKKSDTVCRRQQLQKRFLSCTGVNPSSCPVTQPPNRPLRSLFNDTFEAVYQSQTAGIPAETPEAFDAAAGPADAAPSGDAHGSGACLIVPTVLAATPLIVDFTIQTRLPSLRMTFGAENPTEPMKPTVAEPGAEKKTKEDTTGPRALWFASEEAAAPGSEHVDSAGWPVTAVPILKEVILQPASHCHSVTCSVSIKGRSFKLVNAELQQQPQEQKERIQHTGHQRQQKLAAPAQEQMVGRARP